MSGQPPSRRGERRMRDWLAGDVSGDRAEIEALRAKVRDLEALLAEGVDLTKDTPFSDEGQDWWGRAYDALHPRTVAVPPAEVSDYTGLPEGVKGIDGSWQVPSPAEDET